jgi:predicted dithiol-disulfide oxidoreductase (DUF899 family)
MAEHHNHHKVVSSEEWLDARKRLLLKEKEFTRARDALTQSAWHSRGRR